MLRSNAPDSVVAFGRPVYGLDFSAQTSALTVADVGFGVCPHRPITGLASGLPSATIGCHGYGGAGHARGALQVSETKAAAVTDSCPLNGKGVVRTVSGFLIGGAW